jgi:hypothetical protein
MTREPNMIPLRDDPRISDPDLALSARILAHVEPLPRSEIRKRRVWNALASSPGRRLGLRFTAVHVAFASVLFAAVSSAAAGHYYIEHRAAEAAAAQAAPAESAAVAKARRARTAAKRVPAPIAEPAAPELPAEPVAEATPPLPSPDALPSRPARARDVSSRKSDADAELLVEAMRARSAGDSARVSQLVDAYRAKHPQGVLQEEALILSIESAVARHAPNAGALGREYLKRFPHGRFAEQARRAISSDAR